MKNPRRFFLMQQTYATLFSLANKLQVKGDRVLKTSNQPAVDDHDRDHPSSGRRCDAQ